MKKINYSSVLARLFYLIISLMPIILVLFLKFKLHWLNHMEIGSIFLFSFWFVILCLIVYLNCFDVDVFVSSEKKLIVKPVFSTEFIVNDSFEVKSISILTMFFNVYLFKVGDKSFIFKHKPVNLRGFSTFRNNAKKIEEIIKSELIS